MHTYSPLDKLVPYGGIGTKERLCHRCIEDLCGEHRGGEIIHHHLLQLAGYNPMPIYDVEYDIVFRVRTATAGENAAFIRRVCETMENRPLSLDETYKFLKEVAKINQPEVRVRSIYQGAKKIKYERRRR